MSVLIRDMEMPKSCSECQFLEVHNLPPYYDDEFECEITYQNMSYEEYKTRYVNCPLVEVFRTGDGLYDTYTPPDKETAKHVTEVIRKSSERMGLEE